MSNKGQGGAISIFTFVVMLTLIAITVAFLYMISIRIKSSGFELASAQAFWLAEAGIQQVIYKLETNAAYRATPSNLPPVALGAGSYSVQVAGPLGGTYYTLASTGTVSGQARTITQSVGLTLEVFKYSLHGGRDIDFGNSYGTINGADISAVRNVKNQSHMNFGSGVDLIEGSTVADPAVNLSTYAALATSTVSGNRTFTAGTYTGIWYVTGDVTINDGVIFNGTIVTEKKIDTQNKANITLNPAAPYPALITQTGKNINLNINESTISGLIYCGNDLTIDGDNKVITINGSLIAGRDMKLSKLDNTTITYDPNLFSSPPPGFSDGSGTIIISVQKDWNEM